MIVSGGCDEFFLGTGMLNGPVFRPQEWQLWTESAFSWDPGQCMLAFVLVGIDRSVLKPPGRFFGGFLVQKLDMVGQIGERFLKPLGNKHGMGNDSNSSGTTLRDPSSPH